MTTHVDRDRRYAAFRAGRSACLRLTGHLDADTARAIASHLHDDRHTVRLRLECSSLATVDPRGARILADALLLWAQRAADRSVDILNLDPDIARRAAWHPLVSFLDRDEILFVDPDGEPREPRALVRA